MRTRAATSWLLVVAVILLATPSRASAESPHTDTRCNCKCPDVSIVADLVEESDGNLIHTDDYRSSSSEASKKSSRSIYINSEVTPEDCDCPHVVLPHLNLTAVQEESFCPRCSCKFETRSLTTIKVVVILVLWVISILFIYMCFLSCLDPMLNRKGYGPGGLVRGAGGYREQRDEDNQALEERPSQGEGRRGSQDGGGPSQLGAAGESADNVIHRIGHQQTKWKRQVQEQRKNIYDRHNMLN